MTHNNTDICISVNYDLKFEEKCCETFQYLWEGSSEAGISSQSVQSFMQITEPNI